MGKSNLVYQHMLKIVFHNLYTAESFETSPTYRKRVLWRHKRFTVRKAIIEKTVPPTSNVRACLLQIVFIRVY